MHSLLLGCSRWLVAEQPKRNSMQNRWALHVSGQLTCQKRSSSLRSQPIETRIFYRQSLEKCCYKGCRRSAESPTTDCERARSDESACSAQKIERFAAQAVVAHQSCSISCSCAWKSNDSKLSFVTSAPSCARHGKNTPRQLCFPDEHATMPCRIFQTIVQHHWLCIGIGQSSPASSPRKRL